MLEAKYEPKLEFPGGTGVAKQKTFCAGSMDMFWNCTIKFQPGLKSWACEIDVILNGNISS